MGIGSLGRTMFFLGGTLYPYANSGGGGLLNRQNLLSVTKVICRQSLKQWVVTTQTVKRVQPNHFTFMLYVYRVSITGHS